MLFSFLSSLFGGRRHTTTTVYHYWPSPTEDSHWGHPAHTTSRRYHTTTTWRSPPRHSTTMSYMSSSSSSSSHKSSSSDDEGIWLLKIFLPVLAGIGLLACIIHWYRTWQKKEKQRQNGEYFLPEPIHDEELLGSIEVDDSEGHAQTVPASNTRAQNAGPPPGPPPGFVPTPPPGPPPGHEPESPAREVVSAPLPARTRDAPFSPPPSYKS